MKTKLFSLALLSLSLAAPAWSMTDKELGDALRNDIKKYLVTLKAPKLIFHWVDASDVTPAGQYNSKFATNAPNFRAYVEKQGKKIFNKRSDRDSDIAGPGLYMASDSLVSRDYGGQKSFGLIVGQINPGAKLVMSNASLTINSKLVAEMSKRGCNEADFIYLLDTTDAACTKIKQLLVGRDVSFAEGRIYSWSTRDVIGCSDRVTGRDLNLPTAASSYSTLDTFVAYSPKMFNEIIGITHKSGLGATTLAKEVMSYLKGQQLAGEHSNLLSQEQMKDASIKAMSKDELKKFAQKHILGCKP